MKTAKSTRLGYVNRNGQEVLRKTSLPGNGHNQRIYALRCELDGYVYGANGADIFERKCPKQGGKPGLPLTTRK
jgi:hypothetical protein